MIRKTKKSMKRRNIRNENFEKIEYGSLKLENKEKGITLIALVITIIILIILATVAINFAFGNNGLINRAEDARDYYANDTEYTDESITNVESYLDRLINGTEISKNTVTYYIDTNNIQTQEFQYGESVLEPNFSIDKEGYTFVGWRKDNIATDDVLTDEIMSNQDIVLYAVLKKEVTLSYNANGGDSTPEPQTEYIYYNNGNNSEATFVLADAITETSMKFQGWSLENNSENTYNPGDSLTLSESATVYAKWWTQTVAKYTAGYTQNNTKPTGYSDFPGAGISKTIEGNLLSWNDRQVVTALAPCTVKLTGGITVRQVDGGMSHGLIDIIISNQNHRRVYDKNLHSGTVTINLNQTINLNEGDAIYIIVWGDPDKRNNYSVSSSGVIYTATPR